MKQLRVLGLFGVLFAGVVRADDAPAFKAVRDGNAKDVQAVLQNTSIDVRDRDGETLLHAAASAGHREIVELLVERKADVRARNSFGREPLHLAVRDGKRDVVEYLLVRGADINAADNIGWTALHLVNDPAICALLLDKGANLEARTNGGDTPLMVAPNVEIARALLARGASVIAKNRSGWMPLHFAATRDDPGLAALLLDSGAPIHVPEVPPISVASEKVARLLLDRGLPVDARTDLGWTSLHAAAAMGRAPIVSLLLERGADANAVRGGDGGTPLHAAVSHGDPAIVRQLLENGADPAAQDKQGATPLDLARTKGKNDLAAVIEPYRHRPPSRAALQKVLDQVKAQPGDVDLRKRAIRMAIALDPPPAVPEDALRAAGKASYVFKSAASHADFAIAADAYGQASTLAPWVPEYYFNRGVALEKGERFAEAVVSFELYLAAAPLAEDRGAVVERIGALEYRATQGLTENQTRLAEEARKKEGAELIERLRRSLTGRTYSRKMCVSGRISMGSGNKALGCSAEQFRGKYWEDWGSGEVNGFEFPGDGTILFRFLRDRAVSGITLRGTPRDGGLANVKWECPTLKWIGDVPTIERWTEAWVVMDENGANLTLSCDRPNVDWSQIDANAKYTYFWYARN